MRTKNSILKKLLVVIILIVMSTNFIMPKYVYAFGESVGHKLVSGIFYLVAYVGDAFLGIIQWMMIGTSDIYTNGEYTIRYSPGIIFANVVPALDVNFITATESDNAKYNKLTQKNTC